MDEEVYLEFAKKQVADLAIRQDDHGNVPARGQRRQQGRGESKQRIFLRGLHICHQGPGDAPREGLRGSDSKRRLALIVTALEKYYEAKRRKARGVNSLACLDAAEYLLTDRRLPLRSLFLQGKRGRKCDQAETPAVEAPQAVPLFAERDPRFAELDAQIKAKGRRPPEVLTRLAHSIRSEVRAWRAANPRHGALFDMHFGAFRFSHWRDAEWYARMERVFESRIDWAEHCLHPSERTTPDLPPEGIEPDQWERIKAGNMCTRRTDVGEACVNLAHLCHEQRKFQAARPYYEKALGLYETSTTESHRALIVPWVRAQIARCETGEDADSYPALTVAS